FHQFAWTLLPWLGVSELEKVIIKLSATLENIENVTTDAIQALQQEVAQVSQTTVQNHLALEYLLAMQGGTCALVNTTCCVYVNQDLRIETDLK
ncbi:ERVV2 protein, partial [Burhinus bistriatus]|nr:ERVV2 protein [Burhinus bistriatus]